MKHLRRYNENWGDIATYFLIGVLLYKFLRGFILDKLGKSLDENATKQINKLLNVLKNREMKIPVNEFNDRYFIRLEEEGVDIRIMKEPKAIVIDDHNNPSAKLSLTDEEFDNFIKIIKPNLS